MNRIIFPFLMMLFLQPIMAQEYHSDQLETVANLGEYMAIGLSVSSENRVFVSFPYAEDRPYKYGLAEVIDGETAPA